MQIGDEKLGFSAFLQVLGTALVALLCGIAGWSHSEIVQIKENVAHTMATMNAQSQRMDRLENKVDALPSRIERSD